MGVPMLRPSGQAGGSSSVSLLVLNPAWLDVFSFCSVQDLGACLAVDRHWLAVADSHHVWADAYDRTQRVDDSSAPSGEGGLRSLIERPFGEDAVGWHVSVLVEDGSERYSSGHIVAYSAETDMYLVAYDPDSGTPGTEAPRMSWEQERRKRTPAMRHNPSLAGKSRFSFLTPPSHLPGLLGGSIGVRNASSLSSCLSSPGISSEYSYQDEAFRERRNGRSSWKQELRHNVLNAPSRFLARLDQHTDEVLFVVFSPCGSRLASCSRDLRTVIFRIRTTDGDLAETKFELEAVFVHQTAPCRAMWWPIPPYNMVAVSTEDAGWQVSKVEIWQIGVSDQGLEREDSAGSSQGSTEGGEDQLPSGENARCVFQCHNRPFDIYAAIFPWPPALDDRESVATEDPYSRLCFLAGWAVLRENEHYVQWLNVWPGPRHPSFREGFKGPVTGTGMLAPKPLARLRLEGEMNYLHCLEVGPADSSGRQQILAMTGSTPHLCNEIGLIDLQGLQRRGDGPEATAGHEAQSAPPPVYDVAVQVFSMGERVVLSAKWNTAGDLILLNTRPYAHSQAAGSSSSSSSTTRSSRHAASFGEAAGRARQASPDRRSTASFEDLLLRPAPDLSTRMELLLVDAQSLSIVGVFDGHFAFTTKESPFLIFTDEWAETDFVASGGEDHRVYIWHRRHGRLIRRLCGHTEPVNSVSWNGHGLLASASDDYSIIVWAARGSQHAAKEPRKKVRQSKFPK
eukprot:TRINITY_DN27561_c0_g1_i2.p1 TRINITY_DN27561_c0_g1~~TRINITY_DN27561_c0_g1_i2.p1  ORF type:complete len:737 (-),score=118.66 TRINITY_DN27561_c0_g1_i2:74-2284(-)